MSAARVGFDIQPTLGRPSGIGRYTRLLIDAIRRIDGDSFSCVEIGGDMRGGLPTPRRLWWERIDLPRRVRRRGLQLFHATGFAARPGLGVPQVWTLHDLIPLRLGVGLGFASRRYWTRSLPASARWADRIVADSEATRRDALELLGLDPARVRTVPLAPDPSIGPRGDAAADAAARQRLGIQGRYVLSVGTLEPRKNLPRLIEAFAPVAAKVPDAALVLAGEEGWGTAAVREAVVRHRLADRVRIAGYVAPADLGPLYRGASFLAFPSRYEGFGLPPLEAMAAGTPVIASDASSVPEVVGRDGEAGGVLLPPDDPVPWTAAMLRWLQDEADRKAWADRALARSAAFSWDRCARETVSIYRELLGGGAV